MSRLIAFLVGLIIILVAAIIIIPMLIPMETYKNQVTSIIREQTGRDLRIDGDIGLSFFPNIAVSIEDAGFSNADWATEKEMASMKEVRAALKLMPLLSGNIEIDSFSLVDPVIHLEVRKDGTPNWQFGDGTATPAAQESDSTKSGGGFDGLSLGDVSIKNGRVSYRNAQTGAAYAAEEVNVDLELPNLDEPFLADGSLVWNGDRIDIDVKADRPRALTQGGETPVNVAISAPKIKLTYQGTVKPLDGLTFAGDIDFNVPSVRELAAWAGNPLPAGDGFGHLAIKGKASGSDSDYRFANAAISFDDMKGTGNLAIRTSGARPHIKGDLAVDRINVNTYLADNGVQGTGSTGGGASASNEGWSTDPIDLSGLKAIDGDFSFSTQEILFQEIKIGESALGLKLQNGLLNANLSKLSLYEGTGSGTLSVNGASATPQVKADFRLSGVSAEPLLTDAIDFARLQGKSAMEITVSTSGRSQRDMVSALNGKGHMRFTDGSIKGINLAQLTRTVLSAATSGWQAGGTQDTDFSELGGSFTINQGILDNNDLKLLSPLIRVSGSGKVNLPDRTLNYRVEPKLTASLEGQGGASDAKGIEVPIIVSGPWASPRFAPDLKSIIENRENIGEAIKSIREDGGKGLLKGLMGEPANDNAASGEQKAKPDPKDALKQLFGR